jgi:methylmalonyl-CoA mutase cobalamin-binding subunit
MSPSAVRLLFCGDVQTGARPLRDAGHEVVVLEPGVSAAQLAAIAVQEDVAVIAVADPELGAAAVSSLDSLGAEVVVFWITSPSGPS